MMYLMPPTPCRRDPRKSDWLLVVILSVFMPLALLLGGFQDPISIAFYIGMWFVLLDITYSFFGARNELIQANKELDK